MSETISISASAAAIFCSEESWGRPPKRKDILYGIRVYMYRSVWLMVIDSDLLAKVVWVGVVVGAFVAGASDDVALRGSKDLELELGSPDGTCRTFVQHHCGIVTMNTDICIKLQA
jgi:hypothetical protein